MKLEKNKAMRTVTFIAIGIVFQLSGGHSYQFRKWSRTAIWDSVSSALFGLECERDFNRRVMCVIL